MMTGRFFHSLRRRTNSNMSSPLTSGMLMSRISRSGLPPAIKAALERLTKASHKLAEAMYAKASQKGAEGAGPGAGRYVNTWGDAIFAVMDDPIAMMDYAVAYETETYNRQHPIGVVNWPPLDPLFHATDAPLLQELRFRVARVGSCLSCRSTPSRTVALSRAVSAARWSTASGE